MNNERKWILRGGRVLNPAPFCLIGIVNVTPDSFSDGGKYIDPRNAVAHGLRLLDEGAGMLDLGAESTRPFAEPVPEGEEIARLMPVVARLREQRPDAVLSVDTLKAGTARAALEGGADIINDVSACVADPALLDVLAEYKPGYVLMHSQGSPREMQVNPRYGNVVEEILAFFEEHLARLVKAGLPEDRIVLDPGIGFGKNKDHTVAILKGLERFASLGRPLYVGLSRKSMFRTGTTGRSHPSGCRAAGRAGHPLPSRSRRCRLRASAAACRSYDASRLILPAYPVKLILEPDHGFPVFLLA